MRRNNKIPDHNDVVVVGVKDRVFVLSFVHVFKLFIICFYNASDSKIVLNPLYNPE